MTYPIAINDLAERIHNHAKNKGFWNLGNQYLGDINFIQANDIHLPEIVTLYYSSKIALIHSEASEALECLRENELLTKKRESDGKPEGLGSELADVIIRCMDLMQYIGYNVEQEIIDKIQFNETRPFMHGGKAI